MLVYFVNHSTAPVSLGGAERSLIGLVEDWYASDPAFEACFLTKHPRGKFVDAIEQRGWAYHTFPFRGWALSQSALSRRDAAYFAREDYRSTLEMVELLERRRPDLVVTNTVVAPWGAFAAAVVGVPHAWFVREYGDLDHGLHFQIGRAHTFSDIDLLSQAIFTNSFALKRHVARYADEAKISVVYPRIDVTNIEERARLSVPPWAFPTGLGLKIAVVGRLAESKGQWRVIEALALLASRGIPASACFVGSREQAGYDQTLAARARALGLADRVTIAGEQENPFPFIAAADVCVTPSGVEAFGRSTLEYMLLSRPVVASDGGGSSELVHDGTTGFLFDPADISALADRLARYADDPDLLERHGLAGAARAREFLSGETSNAKAIDRLKNTAALKPYRLPNAARYWFGLPELYLARKGQPSRLTLSFIFSRVRGRVGRVMMATMRRVRGDRRR